MASREGRRQTERAGVTSESTHLLGRGPVLACEMGLADIEPIRSEHAMADAKHSTAEHQETSRPRLGVPVSPRALAEIYHAPFGTAVEQSHVASIMCAYGAVNHLRR